MKLSQFSRVVFLLTVFGVSILSAACRAPSPPPATPAVPPTAAPTALPPAPTAPPLTAAPTAVVPTAVVPTTAPVIPTATPIAVTATAPAPTSTTASGGAATGAPPAPRGSVTISTLRVDPAVIRNKEAPTFYATFRNTTGKDENTTWCVEVIRPGERKSFGITHCSLKTIPPGVSEQASTGWEITGVRECIPVRAHAVVRDELDVRTPILQSNGQELWLDFSACP